MNGKVTASASVGQVEEVVPAAGRTINSLRDIGYELPQAIADLVDNSIEAEATEVRIDLVFEGAGSWIRIADNGTGMDPSTITESLRIGSIRDYGEDDLGKFGMGLKTASISQCRRLVVASRVTKRSPLEARAFDLAHIEHTDKWEVLVLGHDDQPPSLTEPLEKTTGTVVLWQNLDRVLTYKDPNGLWAQRKLLEQTEMVADHLAMVFHRFLSGQARNRQTVRLFVNGANVEPWDPFCLDQPSTTILDPTSYEVVAGGRQGIVTLRPYVLPGQSEFSDAGAWNRASGPNRWNNQQGLYIYRADRLIQWGGWNRLRTNDEHTKLARVSLDFSPDLDAAFGINISKAIVKLPLDLKDALQPVVRQVCSIAQERYRNADKPRRPSTPSHGPAPSPPAGFTPGAPKGSSLGSASLPTTDPELRRDPSTASSPTSAGTSTAIRPAIESAAERVGEVDALARIVAGLLEDSPEVARELGW